MAAGGKCRLSERVSGLDWECARIGLMTAVSDRSAGGTSGSQGSQAQRSRRILVVDDNSDAAETLAELLGFEGYEVRSVGDGEAVPQLLDSYVPDVALLDIGLPGMDGYQLAALLRADPRAAGMKLIALTGYDRDNARAQALAGHFDEHLVKPVVIERLLEVLRDLMPPGA